MSGWVKGRGKFKKYLEKFGSIRIHAYNLPALCDNSMFVFSIDQESRINIKPVAAYLMYYNMHPHLM